MEQRIRPISTEMHERIEQQREWVKGHYVPESQDKYGTVEGKLYLLESIFEMKYIAPDEKWKLQCLGITFGDALVQELQLHWVEVDDEYGLDPALQYYQTSILMFPLTMISKRVERGDTVDVRKLFAQSIATMKEEIARAAQNG